MSKGIALLAHGSRDDRWKKPFILLENKLRKSMRQVITKVAYLQDSEPDIWAVVDDMAQAGVDQIVIAPMFLAVGAHSRKDFPIIAKELKEKYSDISFEWTEVIGEWEETLDALGKVISDKLAN